MGEEILAGERYEQLVVFVLRVLFFIDWYFGFDNLWLDSKFCEQ